MRKTYVRLCVIAALILLLASVGSAPPHLLAEENGAVKNSDGAQHTMSTEAPGGGQAEAGANGGEGASAEDAAAGGEEGKDADRTNSAGRAGIVAAIPAEMKPQADNGSLALYVHPGTAEAAVLDKASGVVWYTNPPDRETDAIASGANKSLLAAQFTMVYMDQLGKQFTFDSYTHSVQNGDFRIEPLENGVRITYTLSNKPRGAEQIPKMISEERFRTLILDKLETDAQRRDIERRFKYNEEKKVYERRDAALRGVALQKTLELFAAVGYDEEQMAIDRAAYEDGAATQSAVFTVPVEYRLDGRHLLVTVPAEHIVQPERYKLHTLSLLPYFGAAGMNEEGYMFVPDGSGALIRLNNGKLRADPYLAPVYGTDRARQQLMQVQFDQPIRLPVFGMKRGDRAFYAVIEDGDAVAQIEADISEKTNSYNRVYSSYTIVNKEDMTLQAGHLSNTVPLFQAEPFRGNITVRYGFLYGNEAGWEGMAASYRELLIGQGRLTRLEEAPAAPFYLELVGGITKTKFFLGIPYTSLEPLTTFAQAETVLAELGERGIDQVRLRLTGWFNGGVSHRLPESVKVDRKLGGKKGLEKLLQYAEERGIDVFLDVAFMRVNRDSRSFSPSREAARFINGRVARQYPYNLATYRQEDDKPPSYLLSPSRLADVVKGYLDDAGDLPAAGVSLRDLADELHSDYREKRVIDREEAKRIAAGQLAAIGESVDGVMVEGGNAYALPYADHVLDAPFGSSEFFIEDETVPFYQVVVHGYVDYAGPAVNLAGNADIRPFLLRSLEYGANLHFSWFYAPSSAVKNTDFQAMYSGHYRTWLEDAAAMYKEIGPLLNEVRTLTITGHRKLAEGVYETTFEGGKSVIVNYNDTPFQAGDVAVGAEDYALGGDWK